MTAQINFKTILRDFSWWKEPGKLEVKNEQQAFLSSGPATNFFIDPAPGGSPAGNAPLLCREWTGPFTVSAEVAPQFEKTYDAGGFMVMGSRGDIWCKLAYELTDLGYAAVVSVVTNKVSDDANGPGVRQEALGLQIVRSGNLFAMHYALAPGEWQMLRYCALPAGETCRLGIFSQSPLGEGNRTGFTNFCLQQDIPQNIRAGK